MPDPNDPKLRSFIDTDPCSDFPIQNLPYGVFSTREGSERRVGVAIGAFVLDLAALERAGLLKAGRAGGVFASPALNPFMALGPEAWRATRARISALLRHDNGELRDDTGLRARALIRRDDVRLHLPVAVAGYTDFYSSREHATNVGVILRGKDKALQPNWHHIPIAYNGRASTVVVGGTPFHRPCGQIKLPDAERPVFGPSRRLDFELEMATVVGTPSAMGTRLGEHEAAAMIFGFALLNDWSARDIQAWEYAPLGPFQAKAFATSMGPWIVTREALEPFRVPGPAQDPEPLPYLRQSQANNYDVRLEVALKPATAGEETTIARGNFRRMYWSAVQQLVHHAASGCAMNVGDLLGSGTISGPTPDSCGSLLELGWNGARPLSLPGGESRAFLEDGDSLTLRGWCEGDGYRVGFGEVEGTVLPARV